MDAGDGTTNRKGHCINTDDSNGQSVWLVPLQLAIAQPTMMATVTDAGDGIMLPWTLTMTTADKDCHYHSQLMVATIDASDREDQQG